MTPDPVLHALVDLCQAVEAQGMVGPATQAYQNALTVIREHTAPSGSPGPLQPSAWIATHDDGGRTVHFSREKGWKVEAVAFDPSPATGDRPE